MDTPDPHVSPDPDSTPVPVDPGPDAVGPADPGPADPGRPLPSPRARRVVLPMPPLDLDDLAQLRAELEVLDEHDMLTELASVPTRRDSHRARTHDADLDAAVEPVVLPDAPEVARHLARRIDADVLDAHRWVTPEPPAAVGGALDVSPPVTPLVTPLVPALPYPAARPLPPVPVTRSAPPSRSVPTSETDPDDATQPPVRPLPPVPARPVVPPVRRTGPLPVVAPRPRGADPVTPITAPLPPPPAPARPASPPSGGPSSGLLSWLGGPA